MNLVFHISEDGSEIELKHLPTGLMQIDCQLFFTGLMQVVSTTCHRSAISSGIKSDFRRLDATDR